MADEKHSVTQLQTQKILLQGYNVPDGIGDFEHLLDYYQYCRQGLPKRSQVQAVSFVNDSKLSLAKRLIPPDLDYCIYKGEKFFDRTDKEIEPAVAFEKPFMIVGGWEVDGTHNAVLKELKKKYQQQITKMTTEVDVFLNISTPLARTKDGFVNEIVKHSSDCSIRSILEYFRGELPKKEVGNIPQITENSMGVSGQPQKGIKVDVDVYASICQNNNTKAEKLFAAANLSKQAKQPFLSKLFDIGDEPLNEKQVKKYVDTTFFAMGYLQSVHQTETFVKLFAMHFKTIDKDKNKQRLDIMVSQQYIASLLPPKEVRDEKQSHLADEKQSSNEISGKLAKLAKDCGCTSIQILDDKGEVITSYTPKGVKSEEGTTLRLIRFNGISNQDKNTLFSISEAVAGSGDSSFSSVVSTAVFPYLGMPQSKSNFMEDVSQLCKKEIVLGKEEIELAEYVDWGLVIANKDEHIKMLQKRLNSLNNDIINTDKDIRNTGEELAKIEKKPIKIEEKPKDNLSEAPPAPPLTSEDEILKVRLKELKEKLETQKNLREVAEGNLEAAKDDFNAETKKFIDFVNKDGNYSKIQTQWEKICRYIRKKCDCKTIFLEEIGYEKSLKKAGIKCLNVDLANVDLAGDGFLSLTVDIPTYRKIHTVFPNIHWVENKNDDKKTTIPLSKAQLDVLSAFEISSGNSEENKVLMHLLTHREKYNIQGIHNSSDGLVISFNNSKKPEDFFKALNEELKAKLEADDIGKPKTSSLSSNNDEKISAPTNDAILLKNSGVQKITEGLKIMEKPKVQPQSSSGFVKH